MMYSRAFLLAEYEDLQSLLSSHTVLFNCMIDACSHTTNSHSSERHDVNNDCIGLPLASLCPNN